MPDQNRTLRRSALLLFPDAVLNEATLDQIVIEGFTDVGAGVAVTPAIKQQGFSLEQSERLARMCEERGLGMIAFTGYMKYNEHLVAEEPHRLMQMVGDGEVLDLDGLRIRWMCPFRPENKTHYLSLLMEICKWRAIREIHLNDEACLGFGDGTIGCYCEFCQAEFHKRNGVNPPRTANWEDPLWYAWLEARFDNWEAVHSEFRQVIKEVRPDVAVGIQHSPAIPERNYNAWQTAIRLARDARSQDVIATDPYHFNHDDLILHRPHRRILSETTRSLMGACMDRQVDIYPQGFMPPAQAVPMGRQDGLLAGVVPFALGADLVMPFTYEQMKIIPGFFEAFDESRRLLPMFASHRPYSFATMMMPQQSEITGHYDSNWGHQGLIRMVDMVYRTGLPWRWFWDQRLDDVGGQLRGPVILPEVHCLTQSQLDCVNAVAERGEGLLWIGNRPATPWAGSGPCKLPCAIDSGVFELDLLDNHPLTKGLEHPVILSTRVNGPCPDGQVLGTVDGRPALVLVEDGERREAWMAGMPAVNYTGTVPGKSSIEETSNVELLRRLILWIAGRRPLARLNPFPPVDDYRSLRPSDRRAVPTIEMLPMVRGGDSLLAIVFPYTPVRCQTALEISPPEGKIVHDIDEIWSGNNWNDRVVSAKEGAIRIPLDVPGDCDLLAIHIRMEG
jgi:hypothetical protein